MTYHILFVDNDDDFLSTRAEFLEQEGFEVFKAHTISEAEWFLENANIHLTIVDVRMENDDDARDMSGLSLAKQEAYRSIPKIVVTGFPSADAARISLKPQSGERGLAIDYIKKEFPPEIFVQAVQDAFRHNVHINWDLSIDWGSCALYGLPSIIEPGIEGQRLLYRAEEFEDLFRRLFYEKNHIRIERMLWQHKGRVALVVIAFKEGAKLETFVVVCGQNNVINLEAQCFEEYAPKAPGETGTMLSVRAETSHFAANAYTIVSHDLEKAQTLGELFRFARDKVFKDTLTTFFQATLYEWHQDKPVPNRNTSLQSLYLHRLELSEEYLWPDRVDELIKVFGSQIATLGLRIAHTKDTITFQLSNQSFSFPDPLLVFSKTSHQKETLLTINVPGWLTGENIITDEFGHAWLTDFGNAGLAPLFWNFVELEAVIRFDWVETNDLLRRYEMENCLINTDFAKPDTRDLEPIVGKPAQAIVNIRKLAARTVGYDVLDYHLGIFFQAARRLTEFNPSHPLTSSELARLGHILLSMSMIAGKLEQGKSIAQSDTHPMAAELRIIDEKARIILIGDQKVRLAPQPFEILRYLYNHANEVCSKEELMKNALEEEYDESYLPTLIRRIRKKIEDDPLHPRFLITEPNAGYRLIPKPE